MSPSFLLLGALLTSPAARAAEATPIDDYLPAIRRCDEFASLKESDACVDRAFSLLSAGVRAKLSASRYTCWARRRFDACAVKSARRDPQDLFYLRRHSACESAYELRLLARLLGEEGSSKLPLIERSLVPADFRIEPLEELLDTLATSAVNPCDPGRAPAQ